MCCHLTPPWFLLFSLHCSRLTDLSQARLFRNSCTHISPIRGRKRPWKTSVSYTDNVACSLRAQLPCGQSRLYIHTIILLYTQSSGHLCVLLTRVITKPRKNEPYLRYIRDDSEGASLNRNSKVQYIYHKTYCLPMIVQQLMSTQRCCQPNPNCPCH